MVYEFEGKTEREAVENAVAELGLAQDEFDVEILEIQKSSLFKKGFVKIRVHVLSNGNEKTERVEKKEVYEEEKKENSDEFKEVLSNFILGLIEKLGYDANIENI